MKKTEKTIKLGGRDLTLTTGVLAEQADASVLAQYGDTVVLATMASSDLKEDLDYFPLSIEYQERLYAGGRIKGSRWVKREGRPTDEEVLAGRLIDRSLRPLFPKGYQKDVQIVVTVLSVDLENDPVDIVAIAASSAVAISKHPWYGPVSVVRVGMKDGKFILNPSVKESETSEMDLVVSTTKESIVMIEAGAKEVPEAVILGGIDFAQKESQAVLKLINDFAKAAGVDKEKFEKPKHDSSLEKQVNKLVGTRVADMIKKFGGQKGAFDELALLKKAVSGEVTVEEKKSALEIVDDMFKDEVRKIILKGKRVDGRKHTEIRELSSSVGVLPRTHGSAIFKRGSTQALTVTTLGTSQMGQLLESAEGEDEKHYIHHYSMPPYASGETGRIGSPNRREIGHGALAERALLPVIPTKEEFPYAIRV